MTYIHKFFKERSKIFSHQYFIVICFLWFCCAFFTKRSALKTWQLNWFVCVCVCEYLTGICLAHFFKNKRLFVNEKLPKWCLPELMKSTQAIFCFMREGKCHPFPYDIEQKSQWGFYWERTKDRILGLWNPLARAVLHWSADFSALIGRLC